MSAPSISAAYIDQFSRDVRMVYQQMVSRTRSTITNDPLAAENGYFDFVGKIKAVQRTGRAQPVQETPPDITRRKCSQQVWEASVWDDKFERNIISAPLSMKYATALAAGLSRQQDVLVVTAALGTAYGGRNGTTAIPFDTANQQIAATYVEPGSGASSNITTGKIRRTLKILTGNEALPDDSHSAVTFLYSSSQQQSLLKAAEALKVTGTTYESLASGKPDVMFMGMRWIRIADDILPYSSGVIRSCIAYAPDAINYCNVQDINVNIDWVPQNKAWLISGDFQGDAARLRENGVVQILCDEAVL